MDPIELIRQGKVKRFFRATGKITSPHMVSHLTQRAAGKEPLFVEERDYLFMLACLKEVTIKRSLSVYAFCLMPNHVHLLLSPEKDDLADAMRDLFARYASYFNRRYQRKGHLFGGPYRQAVCLDEGYLIAASLYIHNNPVKANICSTPGEYRWSSIRLYSEDTATTSFVSPQLIIEILGRGRKGYHKYHQMLNKSIEVKSDIVFERPDALDGFRKRLATLFPQIFRSIRNTKPLDHGAGLIDFEELEKRIAAIHDGSVVGKLETRKAKRFLIEQLLSRGYKKTEIAEILNVSRKTIYNLINDNRLRLPKTAKG